MQSIITTKACSKNIKLQFGTVDFPEDSFKTCRTEVYTLISCRMLFLQGSFSFPAVSGEHVYIGIFAS